MVNLPFGFQIGRAPAPAAPAPAPQPMRELTVEDIQRFRAQAHLKPVGSTGTEIYAGYPTEEYLQELRGPDRARKFDEMRRSDGQCKMLLSSVMNPIRSATWEIEAADDSPEATLDKLFVEHCLMGNAAPKAFQSLVTEIGNTMVIHGAAAMEKTYKFVQGDGSAFPVFHGIAGLDLISPKTIDRWNVDRCTQRLASITQISNGDLGKGVTDIPAPFLMVFNLDQEGANYEGIGLFRPIYGNYFRKGVYLKLNAIGTEKYAVPTPTVKIPPGFENTPGYAALIAALEVYTSGQSNYLIVPNDVEIVWPNSSQYDPQKVDAAVDAEDRRMAKAFLANFLELGISSGGAFSLSNDLSDFFLSGIEYIGNRICEPFNAQLIPELVRMNRGARMKYPKLRVSGISDKAGKELAEILDLLIKNKVVVPDDKLEESMRKRYGLVTKSMVGQRDVTPPAPMGFGGAPGVAAPGAIPKPGEPSKPGDSKPQDKGGSGAPGAAPAPGSKDEPPKKLTFSELINRRLFA